MEMLGTAHFRLTLGRLETQTDRIWYLFLLKVRRYGWWHLVQSAFEPLSDSNMIRSQCKLHLSE